MELAGDLTGAVLVELSVKGLSWLGTTENRGR